METKTYLKQIKRINCLISNKLTELYQLKTLAVSISVATENERVQSSTKNDRIEKAVIKIIAKEDEIAGMVQKFITIKDHIISQIETIEETKYYQVLFLRYVENETFESIAEKMSMDVRHIYRLHDRALDIFSDKFSHEYKGKISLL